MSVARKRIIRLFAFTALAITVGAVLALLLKNGYFHFLCLFNAITSLKCPGCGNTRAVLSILQLDFSSAFKFNALFPLEFFYILWLYVICAKSYIKRGTFTYTPPCKAFDIAVLVVIVLWFVVRNIIGM